jgi:hypothetical protein
MNELTPLGFDALLRQEPDIIASFKKMGFNLRTVHYSLLGWDQCVDYGQIAYIILVVMNPPSSSLPRRQESD